MHTYDGGLVINWEDIGSNSQKKSNFHPGIMKQLSWYILFFLKAQ